MHMTNAAINWAVASKVRGVAKSVLFVLANRADDNGKCFPSVPTICDECGFSERAVRDAIRQLEREKYIVVHHSWGRQTVYELCHTPARGAPPTPARDAGRHIPPPAADATNPGGKCHQPRREMPPTPAGNAYITQIEPKENPKEPKVEAAQARATQRRGSRLPDDWQPSAADHDFAVGQGLNAWDVADRFRDYWHAKAGKDACKVDWPATWRNWCRREAELGPPKQQEFRNGFLEIIRREQAGEPQVEADNAVTDFLRLPHVH